MLCWSLLGIFKLTERHIVLEKGRVNLRSAHEYRRQGNNGVLDDPSRTEPGIAVAFDPRCVADQLQQRADEDGDGVTEPCALPHAEHQAVYGDNTVDGDEEYVDAKIRLIAVPWRGYVTCFWSTLYSFRVHIVPTAWRKDLTDVAIGKEIDKVMDLWEG